MRFPRLPRWLVLVVAFAVAATGFLAWRSTQGRAVDTAIASTTRLKQTVVVSGRVLAPAKVEVGATITARVIGVDVDDGDKVAAGQTLVRLETAELAAALSQAVATERAAETRIRQWASVGAPVAREQLAQAADRQRSAGRGKQAASLLGFDLGDLQDRGN